MDTTDYFERIVKAERPETDKKGWIEDVGANPYMTEIQPDGRLRHWAYIPEAEKWLRVITEDGVVHNAFFDRNKLREWGKPPWN